MSQNLRNTASHPTVPQDGPLDVAAEVERASKQLRDIILGEEAARESLEVLLKKRRQDALSAVIIAQRHLELVEAEEKRLRQSLTRSSVLHEKDVTVGITSGSHSPHLSREHNEVSHLQKYLDSRKWRLEKGRKHVDETQRSIDSLKRLIEKHDNAESTSLTESVKVIKEELRSEERMVVHYLAQVEVNEKELSAFRDLIIAEQD